MCQNYAVRSNRIKRRTLKYILNDSQHTEPFKNMIGKNIINPFEIHYRPKLFNQTSEKMLDYNYKTLGTSIIIN